MSPPKRALFSLNLDSDADHVYQRVEDHSKKGTDKIHITESKGPTHDTTNVRFVTKPFENLVNRTVDGVVSETGKKVHSSKGEITYTSSHTSKRSGTTPRLNAVSKTARRPTISAKYDTSDL